MLNLKRSTINSRALLAYVNEHLNDPEFIVYLDCCINKWRDIKPECQVMNIIIDMIGTIYKIPTQELIKGKKSTSVPRSLMFYLIKNAIKDLSFETLADMFGRQRSYVFMAYNEARDMLKIKKKRNIISVATAVKKAYNKFIKAEVAVTDEELSVTYINKNITDQEFVIYIDSCLKKWPDIKPECKIMDIVMDTICANYTITIDELIFGKKNMVPRSITLYMIKKSIKNLSFDTLGEMFGRQKSYVFKSYDDAKFMIERHKKKDVLLIVSDIKMNLKNADLLPEHFEKPA